MKPTTKLKTMLNSGQIVVAPGTHDALTAKVIASLGFDAIYMTGYGQSASHLGRPDVGLMTMTEMVTRAANIVEVAGNVPVIADADTGFGNAINVARTMREYEKAGVSAIQLEDQVMPKKCGHMTGRAVIPQDEMVGKIKSALDARVDEDLVIIARTDARTTQGIEAAIERGIAYAEAGADLIFIESPESVEEMKMITSSINKPVLANMVEGGRTPMLPNNELQAIGYNIVIYPTASTYIVTKAVKDLYTVLKETGSTKDKIADMITFSEFNSLIGLDEIREMEAKYSS